ncbi:DUF1127 domain-containing protein [Pseudomonas sp. R2.Fl]|nr:DUF1127 domain-containing protein [Pseudomonas sp. R2.Fl]
MNISARTIDLDLGLPREYRPSRLARLWAALTRLSRALANRRAATRLADLDDFQLADIGLTREDVAHILRTSSLAEDPTRRLSMVARAHALRALPPV